MIPPVRDGLIRAGILEPGGRWSIAMYEGPCPTALAPRDGHGPVLTWRSVSDLRARYVADPFLLRRDSTLAPVLRGPLR